MDYASQIGGRAVEESEDLVATSVTAGRGEPRRLSRAYAFLAVAVAAAALAAMLGWLHAVRGLPGQRVNIRWAPAVTAAERAGFEQRAGLAAPQQIEGRTWSYLLVDRSPKALGNIVSSPLVEDTAHIDRRELRVQLDSPGMAAWLRVLLSTDRLPQVAGLLAIGVCFLLWAARPAIVHATLAAAAAIGFTARTCWMGIQRAAAACVRGWKATERRFQGRDGAAIAAAEVAAGAALAILFLLPLLFYGPYEEEIVQATIFPNQIFYRELLRGHWLFWLNDLGFGSPWPLGDPLLFHPVFGPLAAAAVSLRVLLSSVWIAQAVLMAVYFLRLAAVSGIRTSLRLILLACYLGSAASMTYFYDSDWLQMVVTWSLYPMVIFYLRDAVRAGAETRFWFTTVRLALLVAFWILNAHPGYIVPLVLPLLVYTVVAARPTRATYACLAIAALLCVVITAPRVYSLLHELRLFTPGASMRREGSSWQMVLYSLTFNPRGGRPPFVGLGVAVAAVAAVVRLRTLRDPHLRGCAIAFVAAVAFDMLPAAIVVRLLPGIGGWLFRDPMIFFGLIAGGYMLQRGLSSRGAWPAVALLLVLLQLVHQGVVITGNSLDEFVRHRGPLLFYRYQGHAVGLGRALVDAAAEVGRRVYLSPRVDAAMRGRLSADGVHFSSDLVFLGLNPVNGWFKNVSIASLSPSTLIMENLIVGDQNAVENDPMLDVLGVNLVVATESEAPSPSGLRVARRYTTTAGTRLLILANPDAWPRAVLLTPGAYQLKLPLHAGCAHDRALCRDYSQLRAQRLPDRVALSESNGRYVARLPPSDRERLLFISAMYRPEWRARSATGTLAVHPVAGAFVGVTVPAGVTEVALRYEPRLLVALTQVSCVGFAGLLLALFLVRRRRLETAA